MLGLGHGIHTDTAGLAEIFSNQYSLQFNGSTESVQIDTVAADMDNRYGSFVTWIRPEAMSGSTTVVEAAVDANNFIRLWWNDGNTRMKATIKQGGTSSTAQDDSATDVVEVVR